MIDRRHLDARTLCALSAGDATSILVQGDLTICAPEATRAVLPGAFHPVHRGHLRMAQVAARRLKARVFFELSIENVDKAETGAEGIIERVRRFPRDQYIWITRTPTFREKARLFPGVTFVLGADTIARVADVHYYGGLRDRDAALAEIAERGCRFLVCGRKIGETFRVLEELDLPAALRELCDGLSEAAYREDLASRDLREGSL